MMMNQPENIKTNSFYEITSIGEKILVPGTPFTLDVYVGACLGKIGDKDAELRVSSLNTQSETYFPKFKTDEELKE